jgi:Ribonuclease G/E
MTARILAAASPGEIRVAVAEGERLLDYAVWRPGTPDGVGDLHRGRILARVPAMAGAFVAVEGAEGFLPDSAGAAGHTEGDSLAVRVTRAAQGGKGPRLAADAEVVPAGPPALLRRGPGAVERFACAYPGAPILADDAALVAALRPSLAERLSLVPAAFDAGLTDAVAELAEPSVVLDHGVVLHIHPTPALVAIDVDAGRATASRQPKAASQLAANRAALPAVARAIRLRNLSGAILVDLAGLSVRKRATLGPALAAALAADPLRPRLLGFTALGLAEIVRPRVHPPLHEMLAGPLAAGLAALRRIAAEAARLPHRAFRLRASPAVVAALDRDPVALSDLARRTGRPLILSSDPALPPNGWTLDDITA